MKKLASLFILIATGFYLYQLKENVMAFAAFFDTTFTAQPKESTSQLITRQLAQVGLNSTEERRSPLEVANEAIQEKKAEWKIRDYHEMRAEEVSTPLGTRVTYSFFQDNIPVLDQSIQVVVSKRGKVLSIENNYHPLEKAEVNPADFSDAIFRLKDKFMISDSNKVRDPVLYPISGMSRPTLAFPVTVRTANGPEMEVLVRGNDGEILAKSPGRKEF